MQARELQVDLMLSQSTFIHQNKKFYTYHEVQTNMDIATYILAHHISHETKRNRAIISTVIIMIKLVTTNKSYASSKKNLQSG